MIDKVRENHQLDYKDEHPAHPLVVGYVIGLRGMRYSEPTFDRDLVSIPEVLLDAATSRRSSMACGKQGRPGCPRYRGEIYYPNWRYD